MNSMKRLKDRTLKDELHRSVGAQYATGDQWRTNHRENEEMELKKNIVKMGMLMILTVLGVEYMRWSR